MSKKDKLNILLRSSSVNAPVEWPETRVGILAEKDEIQPDVDPITITLTGEARDDTYQHVQDGLNGGTGIFEGIPVELSVASATEAITVLDGMLDLTDGYTEIDPDPKTGKPQSIEATIKKLNGVQTFRNMMASITAADLIEDGDITPNDYSNIKYIVSDLRELPFKTAFASVLIYETIQKIQETIDRIQTAIANGIAHAAGGPTGPIAAVAFNLAVLAIEIAFTLVMAAQAINIATEVITEVLGVVRTHKGITIRKYFEAAAAKKGYTFSSPIADLDWVMLPSNLNTNTGILDIGVKSVTVGVPAPGDPGYNLANMMQVMEDTFNGKFFVSGNTVQFRTLSDDFWRQNTTFSMPDVRLERKTFNTQDIVANIAITMSTDIEDNFTIDNWNGTSITINTDLSTKTQPNLSNITGFDDIQIPFALGNRKDKLNILEETLKVFAEGIQNLLSVFGINASLVDKINDRKGLLKVSTPYHTVAKLLKMNGSLLDVNYRSQLSAEYLWDTYISERSFVTNANRRQRVIYTGLTIPFRLSNFLEILENTFFQLSDGRVGKLTKCEWDIDKDSAEVDFYIEERYTTNLRERKLVA